MMNLLIVSLSVIVSILIPAFFAMFIAHTQAVQRECKRTETLNERLNQLNASAMMAPEVYLRQMRAIIIARIPKNQPSDTLQIVAMITMVIIALGCNVAVNATKEHTDFVTHLLAHALVSICFAALGMRVVALLFTLSAQDRIFTLRRELDQSIRNSERIQEALNLLEPLEDEVARKNRFQKFLKTGEIPSPPTSPEDAAARADLARLTSARTRKRVAE